MRVPDISVIVPVCNEAENIAPLIEEIAAALPGADETEILYVDDGSTDDTALTLKRCREMYPQLRVLRHGERAGQSCAIRTGVLAARGRLICVLDGDGQNDPADLPRLIAVYAEATATGEAVGMVMGEREKRQDSAFRRFISRVANSLNRTILGHEARDVGCGLKVVPREVFLRLPYFDHMHRFMPALIAREDFTVRYVRVNHRARPRGMSKYGTIERALAGIVDLIGVYWLRRRSKRPTISEG